MVWDIRYLLFSLPALLLAIYAQWKVRSTYERYLRVPNAARMTGIDAARTLLRSTGLSLKVEGAQGVLSDHYDPRSKTLRLSRGVAESSSVGAVAIVAHEMGHAMQDAQAIRASFAALLRRLLGGGSYVAIATHDEELIVAALDTIAELGLPREAYEFQMLLGVRGDLARLLAEGHTVRIYVPYGPDSYAYAQRRLRENPQLAGSVARDLLRKLARRARPEGAR